MYISYKHIKESTQIALNTESINQAYEVTKDMAALNDRMAWEYNKFNNEMYESLKYAQDYFQKNGRHASLTKLKKEFNNNTNNLLYDIYLINSEYVIENTTFKPDMHFDFHLVPEALKSIVKAFQDSDHINLSSAINDTVTNTYKKYIIQKARGKDYLIQISISIKNKQNIKNLLDQVEKKIPNLLDTELYILFLNNIKDTNLNILYDKKYKKGSKSIKIVEKILFDDFNFPLNDKDINQHNFKKYINKFIKEKKYKDFYFYRDGKYIHKVIMSFQSYINYKENTTFIISIELDESEAEQTIKDMNKIAYLVGFLVFILFFVSVVIINKRIIKPIETLQLKMKSKESINTKTILNHNDEIGSMSIAYNKLLKDLKREIISNEELLQEFKNFTANTIHQVRTPVSVIKIALEMINTTNNEALLQIKASLISIEHMYDSLSYTLNHEHLKFKKQNIDISTLLKQRIKLFSIIAKAHDINIQSSIEDGVIININQIEAEYLIDNNISNAIKYGTKTKDISIKLQKVVSDISLSFLSYGEPIQDTEIIFERYHRVNEDRKGNGIGLHMVNNICQNNNILIKVDYIDDKNQFTYFFDDNVT